MTITPATGSAGCGCTAGGRAGGPGYGARGCTCTGGGSGTPYCASGQRQGTPRPRFFAGQLLTEDDLEAMTAYVTAKSRLHTRYLAGAGVVCGLEVACHPCGGGTVRVQPGYALDGCGRDIVIACPTDLDVNAMIRDLRLSQLGTDCGDPCPPATATVAKVTSGDDEKPAHEPARHYCLYVRYEEQLTDPVAPYITEEPCGQPACEPTRVWEGYQFLLRYQSHQPSPATIADRLHDCLQHPRITQLAGGLAKYATALGEAAEPAEPLPFDSHALHTAARDLAEADEPDTTLTQEQARGLAAKVEAVTAELARLELQHDATRQQAFRHHEELIGTARRALASAAEILADPPEGTWPDPLDRQAARALIAQARQLAGPQASRLNPVEARMLAQRAPFDQAVWSVLADDAAELRDWLISSLDSTPLLTDGELRLAVESIRIPATGHEITASAAAATSRMATRLNQLLSRYERTCVCAAINPPCPPCDDSGVLLACLEVRDCAVAQVCATVRDWVITGPTLTYWIPQLGQIHELIDAYCCGPSARRAELATGDLLSAPLAPALGTPADAAVADQLTALQAKIDQLAQQLGALAAPESPGAEKPVATRGAPSIEKALERAWFGWRHQARRRGD